MTQFKRADIEEVVEIPSESVVNIAEDKLPEFS
jgi:hypothetical protein